MFLRMCHVINNQHHYYVAVLTGRIAAIARPSSVCPSVLLSLPYGILTRKQNWCLVWIFPRTRVTSVPILSSKGLRVIYRVRVRVVGTGLAYVYRVWYRVDGDWPLDSEARPWHEACLRHSITTRSLQCRWAFIPQSSHATTQTRIHCSVLCCIVFYKKQHTTNALCNTVSRRREQ